MGIARLLFIMVTLLLLVQARKNVDHKGLGSCLFGYCLGRSMGGWGWNRPYYGGWGGWGGWGRPRGYWKHQAEDKQ